VTQRHFGVADEFSKPRPAFEQAGTVYAAFKFLTSSRPSGPIKELGRAGRSEISSSDLRACATRRCERRVIFAKIPLWPYFAAGPSQLAAFVW
jgi:hypothetical protein